MAEIAHETPPFQPGDSDRLGLALFFALALHAVVLLGVTFDLEDLTRPEPRPLALELTLVHSKSDEAPEKADYLAQADQQGGGNVKEKVRPSSPFPNPRPTPEQGDARSSQQPASPEPQPKRSQVMTAETSPRRTDRTQTIPPETRPELPSAAQLLNRSTEIARLSAEIQARQQAYAQMPRHKYISASTKQYQHAAYEDAWRIKVERIGNLNYPEEAKRRGVTGSLMLDVAIRPDGSLHGVEVRRSSGHKVLDDAAVRIVRMAAPFAPFTKEMRGEFDVLHIIRVWQFDSGAQFQTRR